ALPFRGGFRYREEPSTIAGTISNCSRRHPQMIFKAANRRRTQSGIARGPSTGEKGTKSSFARIDVRQILFVKKAKEISRRVQTCASELKGFPDVSSRDYP